MKKRVTSVLLILGVLHIHAQVKGNYNPEGSFLISRQNVTQTSSLNLQTQDKTLFKATPPTNTIDINIRTLYNVKAAKYVAVFNITQVGETTNQTNTLASERINNIRNILLAKGIHKEDIVTDVISFNPEYETTIEKKLFSKRYVEVPTGFELQENLHIGFDDIILFEDILKACAQNEVYNLIKVDYFIKDLESIYKEIEEKVLATIKQKKTFYEQLGFDLSNYTPQYVEAKYCYTPKDFYKSFQAFNSVSIEAITKKQGVTKAKQQTSYFYQPLTSESFDIVYNPTIIEPVIQVVVHNQLRYIPKPEPIPAPEKEYIIINPSGKTDIQKLKTTL
ncbi:hypothetical protein NBRC110019_00690 [Neptunitalea chrysea]|uniref:DUF541 domain-containing protein n=1 Tax=Neptunitalea chrysea TaxID=1647581 RepID=A0A9W6B3S9_9FLAO|nr:SIMPL domain-containing protein [Neptunitalea chrysea]GLB51030.1 hypothetical protein NBRC110019_00690 [Neptunitalea chrysea]